jgi:MFS family permease
MTTIAGSPPRRHAGGMTTEERLVVFASSLGSIFEWYDFYIYAALGIFLAQHFFASVGRTVGLILTLLTFAAGFAVRPLGALLFGRIGDIVGRKYTFLVTMSLMGLATSLIGLLPTYATIGVVAPIVLIGLRLVQGLAVGGEYGGAAIYVAEHAPHGKRGYYTSWIQATATLGLFTALLIVLGMRTWMGEEAFNDWGWRLPFLFSIILLGVSIWIRLQLHESPVFQRMKERGEGSRAPLAEAFGRWDNAKIALLALFGATAGHAVIWYCGQIYALLFLTQTLQVPGATGQILVAVALAIGTPFFVLFGWLSDKIGRQPIILLGFFLAAATYFPLFQGLTHFANPALEAALAKAPVVVVADPAGCHFQFDPVETTRFITSCDIAKAALASRSVSYRNEAAPPLAAASVRVGRQIVSTAAPNFADALSDALTTHGYPAKADPAQMNPVIVVLLLTVLVIYAAMVYGPLAALLVELFPTHIRYSGFSLPYHIGSGWFGGFLPAAAFAIVAATGDIYSGLWYPIAGAAMSFVVAFILLPETKDRDITSLWRLSSLRSADPFEDFN